MMIDHNQYFRTLLKKEENILDEEKYILKQKEEGFRKMIREIASKNESWISYIQSLTVEEKEKEEKKYDEYLVSGKHFMSVGR